MTRIAIKKYNVFLSLIFVLLVLLPLADNIFNFSPVKELFEKRLPANFPNLPKNKDDLKGFPHKFEAFFNDSYGFRKSLITFNGFVMDNVFNESPSGRAYKGKDGWLYFDNHNSFLDSQGLAKIDPKKLEIAAGHFIENWQKLKAQNIDYLLVIAADKTNIYPEFLPDYIKISGKNHRIDKFLTILKKKSPNFPVLDLRPILKEAKKQEVIFHKTDTHWNRRGAHYGYKEIMKKLNLKYYSRDKFENIKSQWYVGDISTIMNISAGNFNHDLREKFTKNFELVHVSDDVKKRFHRPIFFINKNIKKPILFVYKDSFFDNMLYFFAQHFAKSYFINEFLCDLDVNIIQEHKADVVIQQFWENRLEEVVDNCS